MILFYLNLDTSTKISVNNLFDKVGKNNICTHCRDLSRKGNTWINTQTGCAFKTPKENQNFVLYYFVGAPSPVSIFFYNINKYSRVNLRRNFEIPFLT